MPDICHFFLLTWIQNMIRRETATNEKKDLPGNPAKKELQFNCSLTIVSITRVIWPKNYSFFSSNNCSFSSIKNAVLLL